MLAMHHFHIIVEEDDDGFFASCPALPGCSTQGADRDEALRRMRDAVDLYITDMAAAGETIPVSRSLTVATIDIEA